VTFISVGADANDDVSGFIVRTFIYLFILKIDADAFWMQDIVTSLLGESDEVRPKVLTTSYGFNENELPLALSTYVRFRSSKFPVKMSQWDLRRLYATRRRW
jgi:hypothetical protein